MRCPICQQSNQAIAPFCVECGVSLALNNVADDADARAWATALPLVVAPVAQTAPFKVQRGPLGGISGRFTVRGGLALLIAALIINWFSQSSAQAESSRYRLALAAEQQQQWHRAATLLGPLAEQRYAQASDLYLTASQHVAAWDSAHQRAASAEAAGATAQAAAYYRQASLLEPGYSDTSAKLTQLRGRSGQIIYRKPDGLYIATADGDTQLALPNGGVNFELLAVSADSGLICYTYDTNFSTESTRNLVVGDVAHRYYVEQSFLFSGAVQQRPLDAAFLGNGAGLLFIVGGQFGTSASAAPMELYYLDLVGDTGLRQIGLATQVARPNPGDTTIYYVPADDANAIVAYDVNSGLPQTLARDSGRVAGLVVESLPNYGPYLLYALVEDGHLRFYSTTLLTTAATLLLDEPITADASSVYVKIAASPTDGQAIAILVGTTRAWQLQPTSASRLSDALLAPLGPLANAQYSPDGSRLLLTSLKNADTLNTVRYLVLDRERQLLRSDSYFSSPSPWIRWLNDNRHLYAYTHSITPPSQSSYLHCRHGDGACPAAPILVIDTTSGVSHTLLISGRPSSNPASYIATLPDGKSVVYAATDGLYVSALDDQPAAKVIDGATGVWSLNR